MADADDALSCGSMGETFDLLPGPGRLRTTEMFDAKMFKHLR
jgi:hypothetical protein